MLVMNPDNSTSLKEKKSVRTRNLSYEDLLVSKYLEEIQKTEKKVTSTIGHKKIELESPYLQKLSHSNFLNAIHSNNSRSNQTSNLNSVRTVRSNSRANSVLAQRPPSAQIAKFEPYNRNETNSTIFFSNTHNQLQLQNISFRRERPSSAPVKRAKTSSRKKLNNKQPFLIKALAYRNGCRDGSFLIAARNLNEFLSIATERLQLPRAARRIFLENGDEIKHESQFLKNSSVYVSCGEEFEDPFLMTKSIIDKRKTTYWTSNGVHFFAKEDTETTNLKSKNDRQTRTIRFTKRIVCYENGKEYDPCLVVIEVKNPNSKQDNSDLDQSYFKDFIDECSNRMKITAKLAYNWLGERVQSINDIPKIDKCLQNLMNKGDLAPIWISKGEGFDARGAYLFIESLLKFTKENRKEIKSKITKLKSYLDELKSNETNNSTRSRVIYAQFVETNESLKLEQNELNELNETITSLESISSTLKPLYESQKNEGNSGLYNHIKEVTLDDRIVGGQGKKSIKLKVCINGTDNSFETLINHRDLKLFDNIMQQICIGYSQYHKSSYPYKFTRMFTENGNEIKPNDFKLVNNQKIWVSTGENWIDPNKDLVFAVSLKLRSLFGVSNPTQQDSNSLNNTTNQADLTNQDNEGEEKEEEEEDDDDSLMKDDDDSDSDSQNQDKQLTNFFKQKTFFKSKTKSSKKVSQSMEIVARSTEFAQFKTYTESLKLQLIEKSNKTDDWDLLTDSEVIQNCLNESLVSNEYLASAENPIEIDFRRATQLALQCKNNKRALLLPQLAINGKIKEKELNNSIWFSDFQLWRFTQNGLIYNQFFNKLCLTLDTNVSFKFEIYSKKADSDYQVPITLIGYAVVLSSRKADHGNEHQQWHYNKYGNMYCKTFNNQFLLTDLNMLKNDLNYLNKCNILDKYEIKFDNETVYKIEDLSLILIESLSSEQLYTNESDKIKTRLSKELPKCQRWAIKQEGFIPKSNREWKLSKLATFKWNKLCYSWPVDENEQLINSFSWPLSGFLISGAPILKTLEEPVDDSVRSRLRVVKNGCIDINTAVVLSRMEVKNLIKEHKENLIKDSKNLVHCTGLTYSKLEYNAFLDACTSALNLNSAARRLFDEHGEEHFDLNKLDQDQLVYITQGEAWIHPKLVKEDQDRKTLLNNLADDLNKICYFNRMKICYNFVLETSKMSLQEGVKIVLGQCCLSPNQIERIKQGESIQHVIEVEEKIDESIEDNRNLRAHERSHENADAEFAKKFRWPWEQIANKSLENLFGRKSQEFEENEYELQNESDLKDSLDSQAMRERFKPKPKKALKNVKLSSQKFAFGNGYIYCIDNPNLVLGVADIENSQIEVFLMKKNEENPYQRWTLKPNNLIVLKTRPNLALSVKIPPLDCVDPLDLNSTESDLLINNPYFNKALINEASIILQPTNDCDYGNANQKWFIDKTIGLIYAFIPPKNLEVENQIDLTLNVDVTAANKSTICTSYVAYDKEISQPGYLCELIEQLDFQKTSKVLICSSCANAVRGKCKLTKLTKNQNFACYFGKCNCLKEKQYKQYSGFKYLSGKVDLSSEEAQNSFSKWFNKFLSLRKLSNPKSVLNELSGIKSLNTIKLLVYKNGDGRLKPAELLIGSTIQGLLDQATVKLQLRSAARKFYTQDGTLILDVQDLVEWCLNFYKKENHKIETGDDIKSVKSESIRQQSVTFSSNSVANMMHHNQRRASLSDPKESENKTTNQSIKPSQSLLDKVEFSEIAQGSNKNTTIPNNQIIRNESFVSESKFNSQSLTKPSRSEMKRFLNELERSSHVDPKKVLKYPVEVWVSSGEAFLSPEIVKQNENRKQQKREQIDRAQVELEKQTHTLRQMAGRRITKQTTGEYKAVKNPECPVVREGHWSEVPFEEQAKQAEVFQLKNYVDEIKNPNKNIERVKSASQLFGAHPITKRVLVYLNGQTPDKAQYCWATNIDELNEAVKIKFRLNKPIKFFFTEDGKIISRFEDISRDQLVCVSTGREFISAEQRNKDIEIKASWSRKIKEEGINATDIKVNSKLNADINVDPFAVPHKQKKHQQQQQLAIDAPTYSNKSSSKLNNNKNSTNKSFTDDSDNDIIY